MNEEDKIFKVDWKRVICEAFKLEDHEYDAEQWSFIESVSSFSINDLIKIKDAILIQAKEQGINESKFDNN